MSETDAIPAARDITGRPIPRSAPGVRLGKLRTRQRAKKYFKMLSMWPGGCDLWRTHQDLYMALRTTQQKIEEICGSDGELGEVMYWDRRMRELYWQACRAIGMTV